MENVTEGFSIPLYKKFVENNSKVEVKTREGKKMRGRIIDLGRSGVIVRLENGKTLGVGIPDYQLVTSSL